MAYARTSAEVRGKDWSGLGARFDVLSIPRLGWGCTHVLRRSLASTRQVILSSGYALRRSTTLSCENKQSASLSTAVNGNDGVAFNFTDSRASSQTWSAMAHWLFTTERVRMNE